MMSERWAGEKIVTMNGKVYCVRFEEDLVGVASVVKQEVDLLDDELDVSKVYHCDGLVLCVGTDKKNEEPKLVLWNPCLSQTRLIEPRGDFNVKDRHAIGYSEEEEGVRNHKILRFVDDYTPGPERKREVSCEVYEIRSNSWKVLDVVKDPEWKIDMSQRGVSVKGNTYFFANHLEKTPRVRAGCVVTKLHVFLLCFDFAKESFGPRLPLPFDSSFDGFNGDIVTLSSFRDDDEQLAVLFGGSESGFFEIWVVDPNRASWSRFLRVGSGFGFKLSSSVSGGSFFVDEENKVAVLFELDGRTKSVHTAFVFGQDGGFKSFINLAEALLLERRSPITNRLSKAARPPLVCSSSYRPSSVQVKLHKRKRISPPPAQ